MDNVGHTDCVRNVVFAPDGETLLTSANDRTARLWDARSGACLRVLEAGHIKWCTIREDAAHERE